MIACTNCGADWTQGEFTADCPQCGGGAMERACGICEGRCGNVWRRAVMDSQDANMAHWMGRCGLPEAEQLELMKKHMEGGS